MRATAFALVAALCGTLVAGGCAARGQSTALLIHAPDEDRDAEVYVDGNYIGQVRALDQRATGPLLLAPGVHRVEVRKPGRFPVQRTVRVDGDTPAEIVVDAELLEDPEP
ncbi:MAG: hypothetical protein R3A79_15895 [Nannocystaceae bacterium]